MRMVVKSATKKRLMELGHNPDGSESSIEPEKIVTLDDIDPVQV